MKKNPITLITAGLIALIFLLMLFTFQVRQTEVAVVTTFGRYSRSIESPGLQFRLPWPFQKVYTFDNRIHNFERKFEQNTTRDAINVLITVYAGWRIENPRTFLESFSGDMDKAEETLEPLLRNVKNGVIGQYRFGDLISTNQAELKFDQIEGDMLKQARSMAGKQYGVKIEHLRIKRLGLPEGITTKVFERMKAERQKRIKEFQSQGERQARIIRSEADIKANEILADARAQAIRITGDAEARASASYSEFQKNPELAKFLFDLRALEQSLKDKTTLILDQRTPPFNLLNGAPSSSK